MPELFSLSVSLFTHSCWTRFYFKINKPMWIAICARFSTASRHSVYWHIRGFWYCWCRWQLVQYRNVTSAFFDTLTGVAQDSHLGPILLYIYINDVKLHLACLFLLNVNDLVVLILKLTILYRKNVLIRLLSGGILINCRLTVKYVRSEVLFMTIRLKILAQHRFFQVQDLCTSIDSQTYW